VEPAKRPLLIFALFPAPPQSKLSHALCSCGVTALVIEGFLGGEEGGAVPAGAFVTRAHPAAVASPLHAAAAAAAAAADDDDGVLAGCLALQRRLQTSHCLRAGRCARWAQQPALLVGCPAAGRVRCVCVRDRGSGWSVSMG